MSTHDRHSRIRCLEAVLLCDRIEIGRGNVSTHVESPGHKGQPEVVQNKGRKGRRNRLKGKCGRGTLDKERPPVFGMIQRGGQIVISMIANVKQKTIEPFIKATIAPGHR